MKKTYQKPGMYIESFALSQSIATDCGAFHDSTVGHPAHATKASCGWAVGDDIIWVENYGSNCNDFEGEDVPVYGICYNNPANGNAIFNS